MKTTGIALVTLWLSCIAAWITSIVHDIQANDVLWVVVDILLSPVGVIRGFLIWFGAV